MEITTTMRSELNRQSQAQNQLQNRENHDTLYYILDGWHVIETMRPLVRLSS